MRSVLASGRVPGVGFGRTRRPVVHAVEVWSLVADQQPQQRRDGHHGQHQRAVLPEHT
jgi:hypothetical protein